jgi:protease IV
MNVPAKQPFFLWRLLRGVWDTLNFGRRLVLNFLFLLLLGVFVAALVSGPPRLDKGTVLVLAPEGLLVEQFSADPVERALNRLTGDGIPEVQLRDLIRVIDAAAKDERISHVLLRPDALAGAGLASLREVAAALQRLRASGKPVVAYAEWMEQRQYFLAAQANRVLLHPEGMLLLEGLASYRSYFREAIEDKLAAQVHLFRAGQYKSYGEPYIRDGASEAAREADRAFLGDLWTRYLDEVAAARGLDAGALQTLIDGMPAALQAAGGDFALLAEQNRLIDARLTEDAVEQELIAAGAGEEEDGLRQIGFDAYLAQIQREQFALDVRPQVAIVVAEGEVVDGEQPPGTIGGRSTAELLRRARDDDEVKAVVVRVDSPGGSAFASEQVRRELDLIREAGKPVVVSMGDLAASGGYWIALGGDHVIADPSTITGSIGVFVMFVTFPDTLAKLGVRVDGVGTTAIAGALDPRRPLPAEIGRMFQSSVDKIYRDFVQLTATARNKPVDAVDAVAGGRVWTGAQALEHGLVDRLGSLQDAIDEAAQRASLAKDAYQVRYIEVEPTPWQQFVNDLGRDARLLAAAQSLGVLPLLADRRTREELRPWLRWLRPQEGTPPFRAAAHCFCEL